MIGHQTGGDLLLRVVFAHRLTSGGRTQRDLGAEHRRQPDRARCLGETNDTIETVVIGDRQRLEAEASGFLRQLLGMRCTVEEREVGVAVQFGVGHRRRIGTQQRLGEIGVGCLVGLALAAPCRPIPTCVPRRRTWGAAIFATTRRRPICVAIGEHRFQLPPRHVRVVEPHRSSHSIEHSFDDQREPDRVFAAHPWWPQTLGWPSLRAANTRLGLG